MSAEPRRLVDLVEALEGQPEHSWIAFVGFPVTWEQADEILDGEHKALAAFADTQIALPPVAPAPEVGCSVCLQPFVPSVLVLPCPGSGQRRNEPGRNDHCPCKSGKKFKHCHGRSTT